MGGEGGVNPYGQPDRKKTVIFFDDSPNNSNVETKLIIPDPGSYSSAMSWIAQGWQ